MKKLFGTDGARGLAGTELTAELAYALGRAGATVLIERQHDSLPSCVVGKDTRISGDMLEAAFMSGMLSVGANVLKAGVIPTPAVAYLTKKYDADAGVVISASHNSYEYNGIKFFGSDGYKLADEIEIEIESVIAKKTYDIHTDGAYIGRVSYVQEKCLDDYGSFLTESSTGKMKGVHIALDCANGAAYKIAPRVFHAMGAQVSAMGVSPNGTNINEAVGSTKPQTLKNFVTQVGADIGLAFDGDADRLVAVTEKGDLTDGDVIMYICAKQMQAQGILKDNLLVATVMSNLGLKLGLEKLGIDMRTADVGDRYVIEMMRKLGASLGGEQSGHIIFGDRNTTGDGIFAGITLINAMQSTGKRLSELAEELTIYPQVLANARVLLKNKDKYLKHREISTQIERIEAEMKGQGRVLIRPSGTEPLVRVMIEGEDKTVITEMANELALLIENKLGE